MMMRKRLGALLAVLLLGLNVMYGQTAEGLKVMFWNLENFFDYRDDGQGESDAEFSSTGERRWTKSRFYRKCDNVAKAILWIGSQYGSLPDVVGVAEVENAFVLRQVVNATVLRKLDYKAVHYDSPDERGIDCALLYRSSRLKLVGSAPCRVDSAGLRTRDILVAQFVDFSGDSLAVMVNHHPSKYGGGQTDWKRRVALVRLRSVSDSLSAAGWTRQVAVGDFNDGPGNPLLDILSPSLSLCPASGGQKGSIRFNGVWELIDLAFVSPALSHGSSFSPVVVPFLVERDAAHSGDKPLRTYSGPRYLGGVSDHLPIVVTLGKPEESSD